MGESKEFVQLSGGKTTQNILWLDLETTNLDPRNTYILEVAALITDKNFKILDTFERVIHYDEKIWATMSPWSQRHHQQLWQDVIQSPYSLSQVEQEFAQFVDRYRSDSTGYKRKIVLAGSSIAFDRDCLVHQMPSFKDIVHYKVIDVSSFMEVFKRINCHIRPPKPFQNHRCHRAMVDICNSRDLLLFYMNTFILQPQYTYTSYQNIY